MDCYKVKNILYKYIEKELTNDEMKKIGMHLSSCKECSAEYSYIKKMRNEINSLNTVKAPADFLAQLNRRIDKQKSNSIFNKIFFPLKIKLPLEAAGMLAAIVLIIILFLPENQLKEGLPVSQKTDSLKVENKQELIIAKIEKPELTTKRSADSYIAGEDKKLKAKSIATDDRKKTHDFRTYEIVMLLEKPAEPSRKIVEELEENMAGTSVMSEKDFVPKAPIRSPDEKASLKLKKETANSAEAPAAVADSAGKVSESEKSDEERVRIVSIEKTIEKIKNTAVGMNGRIIEKRLSEKAENKNYVVVEIPAGNREKFIHEVARFGKVMQTREKPADTGSIKNLRYKINFGIINH